MAIDPNIILAGMRPPEQIDPMGVLGRVLTLRNQQQQNQAGQLELQQRQQGVADQHALDQAYAGGLDRDGILSRLPGHLRPVVQKQFAEADEAALKVQELKDKTAAAERDYFGSLAAGVKPYLADPDGGVGAAMVALQHAREKGYSDADQVWQRIKTNPQALPQIVDQLMQQSPKQVELLNAGKTADARVSAAATGAARLTAELPKITADTLRATQETTGSTPMTPYQRAEAARAAAALAETKRHNAATEAAANPFAGMTGPTSGPGPISQASPPPVSIPPSGAPPAPTTVRPSVPGVSRPGSVPSAPAAASGAAPAVAMPTGDEYLKTLPPNIANEVKAYAEGRRPFPAGFALKSPYFQTLIRMVGQYDPSFDAVNYNARNKAFTDLTSPNGTGGKTINALNTAISHSAKLSDLIERLDNYESPVANAVANPLRTAVGSTAVTNFEAVQPQAMKEIERLWRGAGGSQSDIDELKKSLGANLGKQQQREALANFAELMLGKLDSTRQQRDNVLGPIASQKVPVLFDQNRQLLAKIYQRAGMSTPDVLTQVAGAGGASSSAPRGVTVTSPSGKSYTFKSQADADAAVAKAKAAGLWK
jgi:hypothetical protein